ncbi:MAG: DUF2155 domain-containing protein [Rickettsiales bacterium]|jgi:hypothetical protein|nr:DUF2155 domain-containing protein [Rickettsiales bacterium]
MIKKLLFLLLFIFPAAAEVADGEYTLMDNATVQIMNKQAGKVRTMTIPVGKSVKFNKLDILVRKCMAANEFLPEDFFMFAEIGKGGARIFSGWMTKSKPGQNPLQDADNDLWLIRCE